MNLIIIGIILIGTVTFQRQLSRKSKEIKDLQEQNRYLQHDVQMLISHNRELTEAVNEITMLIAADTNLKYLIPFNGSFGEA